MEGRFGRIRNHVFMIAIYFATIGSIVGRRSMISRKPVELQIPCDRIVGGEDVGKCEIKYQVSLQRNQWNSDHQHFCGGSIINNRTVVTAAHCVKSISPKKLRICAGLNHLEEIDQHVSCVSVNEIITHEHYDERTIRNDIALVELAEELDFDSCKDSVKLPSKDDELEVHQNLVTSGWGTRNEGGAIWNVLQKVTVPYVSNELCNEIYDGAIYSSMMCAGVDEGGKDACQGDSGGPLVADGKLYGIVSWGYGCARPNYPGVYTRVSNFVHWIHKHLNNVIHDVGKPAVDHN